VTDSLCSNYEVHLEQLHPAPSARNCGSERRFATTPYIGQGGHWKDRPSRKSTDFLRNRDPRDRNQVRLAACGRCRPAGSMARGTRGCLPQGDPGAQIDHPPTL